LVRRHFPGEYALRTPPRVAADEQRKPEVSHVPRFVPGVLLLSLAALSLSAWAKEKQDAPVPPAFEQESRIAPTVTLTDADAERRVVLAEDEVLEVRLPADRESGYTWIPTQHLLPVFSAYGIPEYQADGSADAKQPGIEIWRFMAEETGTAELVFEYRKPLGADEPPRQTLVFQLAVE